MLDLSQMVLRFAAALILGAFIGLERELVHKEAGIRTTMLVSSGAALFTIVALTLPYLVAPQGANVEEIIARNGGFLGVIANIVIGIGFLGGGIIIKTQEHVYGLTTAALVWVAAAIGILAGLGLTKFSLITTVIIAGLLYLLRKLNISERIKANSN